MSNASNNVTMKLTVDAKSVKDAKAAMDQLADATKKTAAAQKDLNKQTAAWAPPGSEGMSAAGGWNPAGGTGHGRAGGASAPRGGTGHGRAGGASAPRGGGATAAPTGARQAGGIQGGLGPLARFAGPGAMLGLATSVFSNLDKVNIDTQANGAQSAWEIGKSMPLLGTAFNIAERFGGKAFVNDELARMLDMQQARSALNAGRAEAFGAQRSMMNDLATGGIGLRANAMAAADYRDRLAANPSLVRSFFTEDRLGVSNAGTGMARQGVEEARSGVAAAQFALQMQTQQRDIQAARAAEAERKAREAQVAAGMGLGKLSAAEAANRASGVDITGQAAFNLGQARLGQGGAIEAAGKAQEEAIRQRAELQKQEAAIQQRNNDLARARNELDKANMEVLKNRLGILQQEQQTVKSGAAQWADMSLGDRQATVRAAGRLKTQGIDALSPDERSLLQGNAVTSQFYRDAATAAGSSDPLFRQLTQTMGLRSPDQSAQEIAKLQSDLVNQQAKMTADLSKSLSDNNDRFATKIVELLKNDTDSKIAALEAKIEADKQLRRVGGNKP